ncbi:formate dehydrogenase accessory sulfurtransferase FdhD [Rhodoferax mekongensis]|uniref:Formate dehydrogenase accessory sulfurtransferase FdhD n=1 Tax=Rhodoferax mekongensis TaxID=3068341 RepID=A0ABZ0B371_9BURK|nr:formate dehydrogenase accessory sulfurtransferase FdhD [Rhodoferax sp. TBRC 17307]WNO06360.1 formate dehydrogenase accessory sulfurtransferase FdhD [Rhodoferax sp. TBRC 17307]
MTAIPYLTEARAPLTHSIEVVNQHGERQLLDIPAERPLTVYVDKRELVTLMTLGERPEWLVLGYLINQRLVPDAAAIASITVDWEVGAAAVKTRAGIVDVEAKTAKRVVTTGCGQGSLFGEVMAHIEGIDLPPTVVTQAQVYAIVNTIRLQDSTYKSAGSVHGCALFRGSERLLFVEDVGRHNAIDTIAGWMALQALASEPLDVNGLVFYTTGRLTSEMVMKAAQMGVAVVISRSGMTQMGHAVATDLGLCAIGRALNTRFLCFSGAHRLQLEPAPLAEPVEAGV